jgi:PKD repeat protein
MSSNAACATGSPATSNIVTMTVNPALPVSVSIAPSANPVCAGTSVTFSATPTNGGTSPDYQWKVNGNNAGNNSAVFSYIPVNNDLVTCELTSNATCATGNPATSNDINMMISNLLMVDFIADKLTPEKNETVHLNDLTTGGATSWNWTFDRPSVVFVNGTDAFSQNPQVQFTEGGLYTVTLSVNNISCSGSEIKTGYIRAGISGLWSGNISGDWYDPLNWDNYLVPNSNTDVVIPAGATTWPVYDGDLTVGIQYKSLILSPTSKITINGNLIIQ